MNYLCKALKEIVKPWALLSGCHGKGRYQSSTAALHRPQLLGPGYVPQENPNPSPGSGASLPFFQAQTPRKRSVRTSSKRALKNKTQSLLASNPRVPWGGVKVWGMKRELEKET